jgi:dTDP-4-dehydrorhamnose reductase
MEDYVEHLPTVPSFPTSKGGGKIRVLTIGTTPLGKQITAFMRDLGAQARNPGKYNLDVTNSGRLMMELARFRPHVVINCAEKPNLSDAERRPEGALAVNSIGAAKVALACRVNDTELYHISTDQVFSGFGEGGPYDEYADTYPVNAYGLSKLLGENAVRAYMPPGRFLIIRVGWLYGSEVKDGPAYEASETFIRGHGAERISKRAWISDRERGTPTHVGEAAFTIVKHVRMKMLPWRSTPVHVAPKERPISWLHFLEDDFPLVEEVEEKKAGLRHPKVTVPRDGGLVPSIGWETEGYHQSMSRFRRELEGFGANFREYETSGEGT